MKKNVFIVILIIIILGLGGYLVYDKVLSKETVKDDKKETKEKVEEAENNTEDIDMSDAYVVDSYNASTSGSFDEKYQPSDDEKKLELMCNVRLPKINIDSSGAKEFNNKIMSDFSTRCTKDFKGVSSTHIDYSYYVKDNIIFILITQQINNYRGSGYTKHIGYYYDITNDKELSLEDIYNKYEITIDDVNERIKVENENINTSEQVELVTTYDQTIMPTTNDSSYVVYIETTPGTHEIYVYKH